MAISRKGANSERELVKIFKGLKWGCVRIAGSGKMDKAPDIIAGTKGRLLIIECKSSKKDFIYVKTEEVLGVIDYAEKFGGEPWYAFRFNHHPWKFVPAHTLLKFNKVTPQTGLYFEDLISNS